MLNKRILRLPKLAEGEKVVGILHSVNKHSSHADDLCPRVSHCFLCHYLNHLLIKRLSPSSIGSRDCLLTLFEVRFTDDFTIYRSINFLGNNVIFFYCLFFFSIKLPTNYSISSILLFISSLKSRIFLFRIVLFSRSEISDFCFSLKGKKMHTKTHSSNLSGLFYYFVLADISS